MCVFVTAQVSYPLQYIVGPRPAKGSNDNLGRKEVVKNGLGTAVNKDLDKKDEYSKALGDFKLHWMK